MALLHCIIRQMDEPVSYILYRIFFAGSAQIPILIEVASHVAIDARDHGIAPNIELPSME